MTASLTSDILMVIDDSSFDLKITSRIAGHAHVFKEVLCFSSAEEALNFLAENLSNTNFNPFILLDIQMPDMDGFEFMERYEKFPSRFKSQCKVAMLSSTDDLTDIAKADANKHIIKLLKKPLQIKELQNLFS